MVVSSAQCLEYDTQGKYYILRTYYLVLAGKPCGKVKNTARPIKNDVSVPGDGFCLLKTNLCGVSINTTLLNDRMLGNSVVYDSPKKLVIVQESAPGIRVLVDFSH